MSATKTRADERKRARVDLTPAVSAWLDEASRAFGLSRSETLRRLIQASLDVGPALSAENSRTVAALASHVRMVGRNLSQLVHAIHAGRAPSMEAALPIWEILDERVSAIDHELTAMTVAYGLKLRRAAHMREIEA